MAEHDFFPGLIKTSARKDAQVFLCRRPRASNPQVKRSETARVAQQENPAAFRTFLSSLDFFVLLYQDKRTKRKDASSHTSRYAFYEIRVSRE
jgi:hypothetical protein